MRARIEQRLAKATPGPWEQRPGDSTKENLVADVRGLTIYGPYKAVSCGADADFIAHAPDDLAYTLQEITRLREALVAARSELSVAASYANEPESAGIWIHARACKAVLPLIDAALCGIDAAQAPPNA